MKIERKALFYAVDLTTDSVALAGPSGLSLLSNVGASDRYELQAAVRNADASFPFSATERKSLRADQAGNFAFEQREAISTPDLLDRWHAWIWADCRGWNTTTVEALGASAILAESGLRLSRLLPRILGWDSER